MTTDERLDAIEQRLARIEARPQDDSLREAVRELVADQKLLMAALQQIGQQVALLLQTKLTGGA